MLGKEICISTALIGKLVYSLGPVSVFNYPLFCVTTREELNIECNLQIIWCVKYYYLFLYSSLLLLYSTIYILYSIVAKVIDNLEC